MKNVIVFGSYSGNNKGDVAIIKAITNKLSANKFINKIFIPSKDPQLLNQYLESNKTEVFKSVTSYWGLSTIANIRKSSVIVIGGGGLFFSAKLYNPFFNHLINIFLITIVNEILFHRPIYLVSIGISHLNTTISSRMAAYVFKKAARITVRDEASKEAVKVLSNRKAEIFRDPAFTLSPKIFDWQVQNDMRPKVILAINSKLIENQYNALIRLIRKLANNYQLFLYENSSKLDSLKTVANSLNNVKVNILLTQHLAPQEIISLIGKFDLAISAPMHFSIFASLARKPVILIAYNDKVEELAKILNNQNLVSKDNLDKIDELSKHLLKEKPEIHLPVEIVQSANEGLSKLSDFISKS